MSRFKHRSPSGAILVAVLVLVAAVAGTAVAGPDATTSISKKKTTKIAKKQAKKQVNKVLPIEGENLADGSTTASKLGSLTLRPGTPVTVPGGAGQNALWIVRTATASCETGEKLISGTGEWTERDS